MRHWAPQEGRTHAGLQSVFGAMFSLLDLAWYTGTVLALTLTLTPTLALTLTLDLTLTLTLTRHSA